MVPLDPRPALGQSAYRKSLKTASLKEARPLAARYARYAAVNRQPSAPRFPAACLAQIHRRFRPA